MSILNPLFDAVAWVIMRIHAVLAVPFGASSGLTWALSIVILVVLMRLVMVPLFIKQRNSMWKMQSHQPQLQELRKKYKHDKTKLNEETMKFYKENGINPLGGCLPLVAQLPVFWSLFNVLKAIADWTPKTQPKYGLTVQVVESAREARIFGVALYDKFLFNTGNPESWGIKATILVFVLVSAATTFLTMRQSQRRNMMNPTAPDPDQPGAAAAQAMSKNMMYIAPFFALTGLYWQFGLVLYWVTTNLWTLGQQHFLFRKLPIVGSTTVGASAVQPASGSSGAAVKTGPAAKAVKSGTAAKSGAKAVTAPSSANGKAPDSTKTPVSTKTPGSTRAPAGSRNGRIAGSSAAKSASSPAAKAAPKAPEVKAPVVMTGTAKGDAAANGQTQASGSGMLRRFTRSKVEEPQDVPVAPAAKVVRQQPVRQTRSKRGNTGKR